MLYLAYGSNMNADQMKNRCPNSEAINWGYLDGYKLVFDGYSSMRGGLVADIRRKEVCKPGDSKARKNRQSSKR